MIKNDDRIKKVNQVSADIQEVELRDRIPKDSSVKFDPKEIGMKVVNDLRDYEGDRAGWLTKRHLYLAQWDDYTGRRRRGLWEQSSDFHVPLTMWTAKAIHARFYNIIFGFNPAFEVKPVEHNDQDRIKVVEDVMQWAMTRYVNRRKGMQKEVDEWLWDCVVEGFGIAKLRWEREERTYLGVIKKEVPRQVSFPDPISGEPIVQVVIDTVEEEKEITEVLWEGPVFETINPEDFYIAGDTRSVDDAPSIIHRLKMSSSELLAKAKSGFFNKKAVEKVVEFDRTEDRQGEGDSHSLKERRDFHAGVTTMDAQSGKNLNVYSVLEWYGRYDINNDGIDEEVIFWVEERSKSLLRWTYLDRIMRNGKRPFFKIDYIRRPRRTYPIGIAELLFPLNEELDAIHNIRIDYGTFSNAPFGFYKPSGGLKPDTIAIAPGKLVPLDNPQDVSWVQLGNKTQWGASEESFLLQYAERLSSITDFNLGRQPTQVGSLRTATGTLSQVQESNLQLDPLFQRVKEAWSEVLRSLFQLLQDRLPEGTVIRVTSDVGQNVIRKIKSRDELMGEYDFEISTGTGGANKKVNSDRASLIATILANPLFIQTGIVNELNLYNMLKNFLKHHDVRNIQDFITRPPIIERSISQLEEIGQMMQGIEAPVKLADPHDIHLSQLDQFINSDEFGLVAKENLPLFLRHREQHTRAKQVIEAQAGLPNVTGQNIAPTESSSLFSSKPSDVRNQLLQGAKLNVPETSEVIEEE